MILHKIMKSFFFFSPMSVSYGLLNFYSIIDGLCLSLATVLYGPVAPRSEPRAKGLRRRHEATARRMLRLEGRRGRRRAEREGVLGVRHPKKEGG